MILTDPHRGLSGAVVACDKALAVFTVDPATQKIETLVHSWRDVSPPELAATTVDDMGRPVTAVHVRMTRPPLDLAPDRDQGAATEAAIDLWKACAIHAALPG